MAVRKKPSLKKSPPEPSEATAPVAELLKRISKPLPLPEGIPLEQWRPVRMYDHSADRKAVGTTDRQRLKWLIRFANTNPFGRSPEELQSLDWQIIHFLRRGAPAERRYPRATNQTPPVGFGFTPRSESEIVQLRYEIDYGLHVVTKEKSLGISEWQKPQDGLVRIVGRGISHYSGTRLAVFVAAAMDLVASPEGQRICVCAADDCTTIFYKWKRSLYCSKQCAGRAAVRRHREKQDREKQEVK